MARENPQAILDCYFRNINLAKINFEEEKHKIRKLSVMSDFMKRTLVGELREALENDAK